MIKIFTVNESGKIELTKEELESVLDEAYWTGYRDNNGYIYRSPNNNRWWWSPFTCNTATASTDEAAKTIDNITIGR